MKMKIRNYKGCIKVARNSNCIAYLQTTKNHVGKCVNIIINKQFLYKEAIIEFKAS